MGILNPKDPNFFKNYSRKWESQSVKRRQACNMHNSTTPSKWKNTNFSNETAERILMRQVQLFMLYLGMTTQRSSARLGSLGVLCCCFFLSFFYIDLAFTCWLTEGHWALLWSISWMSAQNKGCYQLQYQSHSCITTEGFHTSCES